MLANYFKSIYRHVGRNKVNFTFKLGGLALAFFSLLIIIIYISYEYSFDRFYNDYENIYRVNSSRLEEDKQVSYAMVPPAIGPALKQDFPEIAAYARWSVPGRVMIQYHDKLFRVGGFAEADSTILNLLSFRFLRGNSNALRQPGSVVLSRNTAKQIFGDEDPIGRIITSPDHNNREMTVTAVIEDLPSNSHLNLNAIAGFGSIQNTDINSWKITWDGSLNLYVKLLPDANSDELGHKALALLRKNLVKQEDGSEKKFSIYLQPIADIYLDETLKMEFNRKGNALYVYLFTSLGIFLLVIGCINYVNLSIADFDTRAREMGVRKALGARKTQIGIQITFETLIFSQAALAIAILAVYLIFPIVTRVLDAGLRFEMLFDQRVIVFICIVISIVIFFSSIYPSYRLSLQNVSDGLKSNSGFGNNQNVSKALLLVQCVISIICICVTVIIGKQLSFIHERDLGYNRAGVVSLIMPDEYPPDRVSALRNEMSHLTGVESVSYSYYLMPISSYFKGWYQVEQNDKMERRSINEMFIDHDYFETMGIQLVSGRNFDRNYRTDVNSAFIINETAMKEFGWSDPIGKRIKTGYSGEIGEGIVVGVVKDFNTLSLHKKIEPVIMRLQYDSWPGNSLNVKVSSSLSEMLPIIIATYEKVMPGDLADARVLDDLYKRQYQEEDKAFDSLRLGTSIIILISALGIFSLSLCMSIKRMKEFGIRKVLGATTQQIAGLHIGYFLRIVLLSNIVALPIAYLLMKEWLNDFAYRTKFDSPVFLSVISVSFLLVIISAGYSALKAGRMNPVDVIKS